MIIVATTVGTRGDIAPLCELGVELIKRGHTFKILAQEKFRPLIEEKGIVYCHLSGDANHAMKWLVTDVKTGLEFGTAVFKLKKENPNFMEECEKAVKGADLVMYGLYGGFARHVADYYHIPVVRFFYSPMDKTEQYSLVEKVENDKKCSESYDTLEMALNGLSMIAVNKWRKEKKMEKWHLKSNYLMQDNHRVLSLYPVSPLLMPPDPKWDSFIHVEGYWFHPDIKYELSEDLKAFIQDEKPLFICFGKAVSKDLIELQKRVYRVIQKLNIKAIIQADEIPHMNTDRIHFIGNIPYEAIFPYVRGVVHHGGCTTVGLALYCGRPSLAIPLAMDQHFYGKQIHKLKAGPECLYIRKKLCTEKEIEASILDLMSGKYDEGAKMVQEKMHKENGIEKAIQALEEYGKKYEYKV